MLTDRRTKKRFWHIAIITIAIIFISTLVWIGFGAYALIAGAQQVASVKNTAQSAINKRDLPALTQAVTDLGHGLDQLSSGLSYFSVVSHVPYFDRRYLALSAALQSAQHTKEAIADALHVIENIQGVIGNVASATGITPDATTPYGQLSAEERQLVAARFAGSADDLHNIQTQLFLAQSDLSKVSSYTDATWLTSWITPLQSGISQAQSMIDVLLPLAQVAPEGFGLNGERQFLVLFLNNTELRGGGGFIGAFGLADVKNGAIQNFPVADSYSVDEAAAKADPTYRVNPPAPITQYLKVPSWYFRDAAWSPNFPQTASTAETLLRQEASVAGLPVPDIAGTIGLTPSFAQRLLAFLGPIDIQGTRYDAQNVTDLLEYQVEQGYTAQGLSLADRKAILEKLTTATMNRVLGLSPSQWPSLFAVFSSGFAHKELAITMHDAASARSLQAARMDGALTPSTTDDYLMLVDANLGALKTDPAVTRHLTYDLTVSGSSARATVSATYENAAAFTWKTTRYQSFTRLYVPGGSTLVHITGGQTEPVVTDDAGKTSFGTYFTVAPGAATTLTFTYDLPPAVAASLKLGTYHLLVDKQLGAGDNALTLRLNFGTNLLSATPPEAPADWGDSSYSFDGLLDTNKNFSVSLKK